MNLETTALINAKFDTKLLFVTFFPVLYGLMRYMVLSRRSTDVGKPERVLLTDKPLLASIVVWVMLVVGIVYFA